MRSIIFITSAFFLQFSHADLKQDRQRFLDAESALNKGDIKTWEALQPRLKSYPLYADLVFKRAIQTISDTNEDIARQNLVLLDKTPLRKTYLKSWLNRLAGSKQWQAYLDFYESGLGTKADCHYSHALYKTKQAEKALPVIRKLWLVGISQPDSCDPAFSYFQDSGKLTSELVWQRIELAINKGKLSLVRYLAKLLPQKDQQLVNEWLSIRAKPEKVLGPKYLSSKNKYRKKMLHYGIRRMALFEADKALKHWEKIKSTSNLDEDQTQSLERWLARRLTTQKISGAVDQYRQITHPDKDDLEWASRAALQESNWVSLKQLIGQMGDVNHLDVRWKYWKARANEKLDDKITATTLYHLLASDRGYHHFLAADKLSQPYQFNDKPLQYKADELATLTQDYNVQRAREFFLMDRIHEARREWYYLIRNHGDEGRQKLSYIAKQWGWDSQAILTIATADHDDDLSIRFPVLFKDEILMATKKHRLDASWVMALMRQESAFQPDARSPAGARGLMQLMPGTGRQVAKSLNRRRPTTRELYKPELNILLGTNYLKSNLDKYGGHKVLATAAYNAGPHRVSKWLPEHQPLDADAWAEAIPFSETRGYVERIMSYAVIYDHLLGQIISPIHKRMPVIKPADAP